jgi:hypothetical protein
MHWIVSLLVACAPHAPPSATPPLVAARAPVTAAVATDLPQGTARIVLAAGSAYDPPGREGLAWIAAHALAAQTPGAEVEIGEDVVRFTLPAASIPAWMTAAAAVPTEDALATGRALAARWWSEARCDRLAEVAWARAAYAGHPYGHAVAGRRSVWPTVTPAEVRAFAALRYVRGGMRVATGESVDAQALRLLDALPPRVLVPAIPAVRDHAPPADPILVAPLGGKDGWQDGCVAVGAVTPVLARPPTPEAPAPTDRALDLAVAGRPLAEARAEPRSLRISPAAFEIRPRATAGASASGPRTVRARVVPTTDPLVREETRPPNVLTVEELSR